MPDPAPFDGCAVTIGTFDGVHRGHVALIDALRQAAHAQGRRAVAVTFDPHPLQVLKPESAPRLITTREEKLELFAQLGLGGVVLLAFDERLAGYAPDRFVREVLLDRLGAGHLVVGYDHGFGRGRSGDVDTLRAIGHRVGFGVDVVEPVLDDGEPISSSRIRRALAAGDVAAAERWLGRDFGLRGRVVQGEGRGRALGFPTANLDLLDPAKLLPCEGIYAVRADLGGVTHEGVLHLGPRPTYPGATATIELHLFDFDADLYGRDVGVHFVERLRGIERFASEGALVTAIADDCLAARQVLAQR